MDTAYTFNNSSITLESVNDENRKLVEDVTRFYEGCTYWGD